MNPLNSIGSSNAFIDTGKGWQKIHPILDFKIKKSKLPRKMKKKEFGTRSRRKKIWNRNCFSFNLK